MRRVLVTGATGFVGRHLVESLLDRVEVVAAVRETSRGLGSLSRIRAVSFDLEHPERLTPAALHKVDCVYHVAAHVHVMRPAALDENRFQQLNVRGTQVLAKSAADAGVRRFVYVSSIKVNGERTVAKPFSAKDTPAPEDAYGRSKLAAELALLDICRTSKLEVVIVRPPLVYGPGVGANFRRLISLVNAGWPLPLGAIDNRRSLVSVWNLANLLVELLENANASGQVWLVSDNQDLSTPQMLRMIAAGLGPARLALLPVPVTLLRAAGHMTGRTAEIARLTESLQVDISDTMARLNWRPSMSVEEGIARTARWFVEAHRVSS